jgi:hypothetical protein
LPSWPNFSRGLLRLVVYKCRPCQPCFLNPLLNTAASPGGCGAAWEMTPRASSGRWHRWHGKPIAIGLLSRSNIWTPGLQVPR